MLFVFQLKPEDVMLAVTSQESANRVVELHANICSVTVDSSVQDSLLDYHRFSDTDTDSHSARADVDADASKDGDKSLKGLNFLFFFPQMFEPVDPDIVDTLTKTKYAAMEITCEWLKELVAQNKLYENLVCAGSLFSEVDLTSLQLPVLLPRKTGSFIFNRLSRISRLLRGDPSMSHHDLFAALSPTLCQLYDQKRPPRKALDSFRDLQTFPLEELYSKARSEVSTATTVVKR